MWVSHGNLLNLEQRITAFQIFKGLKRSFISTPKGSWGWELSRDLLWVPCLSQSWDQNPSWHFSCFSIPQYCTMPMFLALLLKFISENNDFSLNKKGIYHQMSLGFTTSCISFLGIYNAHYSIKNSQKSCRKQTYEVFIADLSWSSVLRSIHREQLQRSITLSFH